MARSREAAEEGGALIFCFHVLRASYLLTLVRLLLQDNNDVAEATGNAPAAAWAEATTTPTASETALPNAPAVRRLTRPHASCCFPRSRRDCGGGGAAHAAGDGAVFFFLDRCCSVDDCRRRKSKGQYQPPFRFCFGFLTYYSFNTPYCSSVDLFLGRGCSGGRQKRPLLRQRNFFFSIISLYSFPISVLSVGVMDTGEVRRGGLGFDQAGG